MFRITDNKTRNLTEKEQDHIEDLEKIANLEIGNHSDDGLLVFSNNKECFNNVNVINLKNNKITTNNLMGFIGLNKTELTIESRFSSNHKDYFLHYMLQKVYSINLFKLKHSSSSEQIFDFLLYVFPYYLKKAMRQGLFKEYKNKDYNQSNIKGAINIAKHIKTNIPFRGNVAYSTREQSFDNKVTQLIRHTIEFIKRQKLAKTILSYDIETQQNISIICHVTATYQKHDRTTVINQNLRPIVHPYFSDYTELQRICLQILRFEGLKYGQEKDKIYGILFDGSWLWEEYVYTILKEIGFTHPRNDIAKDAISLFNDRKGYKRYPDFWKKGFIIDAKYKRINKRIDREDMHQIITYMYVKKASLGGFIYPIAENSSIKDIEFIEGSLNGYGGVVKKWGVPIPSKYHDFGDFCKSISLIEEKVKVVLNNNLQQEFNL